MPPASNRRRRRGTTPRRRHPSGASSPESNGSYGSDSSENDTEGEGQKEDEDEDVEDDDGSTTRGRRRRGRTPGRKDKGKGTRRRRRSRGKTKHPSSASPSRSHSSSPALSMAFDDDEDDDDDAKGRKYPFFVWDMWRSGVSAFAAILADGSIVGMATGILNASGGLWLGMTSILYFSRAVLAFLHPLVMIVEHAMSALPLVPLHLVLGEKKKDAEGKQVEEGVGSEEEGKECGKRGEGEGEGKMEDLNLAVRRRLRRIHAKWRSFAAQQSVNRSHVLILSLISLYAFTVGILSCAPGRDFIASRVCQVRAAMLAIQNGNAKGNINLGEGCNQQHPKKFFLS